MHVAVACGGTGGHIFPGLATARELMARGHRVTLWLAGKDVESEAVRGWPGEVITVPAQGLPSGLQWKIIPAVFKLYRAIKKVKRDMKTNRPDVVLAMGSYASVGPVGAAIRLNIPFVLHESNVVPGRAVKLFARRAAAVAGCFDETRFYLRRKNLVITGMPLRAELLASAQENESTRGTVHLLVMGGSRGARALNEMIPEALVKLKESGARFTVTHLTGEQDFASVKACYETCGIDADVFSFTRDMGPVYGKADFAICRAGAATCAELSAFGIPSLLIPYPFAIHDHQTQNARAMEKAGAADMVPERDLTASWLVSYIQQIIQREDLRQKMSAAALARSHGIGAKLLADLIEQTARR